MFKKIMNWIGISTMATCALAELPNGEMDSSYGQMTREEAKAKRKAIKKRKADKIARRRNRGRR